ncbi:MAG TPA: TIM44-like domain-containing protein [Kofleriaceae bacterium]|nr:TIM44-like domain-containing protein [Kofleriaceae bacterium]
MPWRRQRHRTAALAGAACVLAGLTVLGLGGIAEARPGGGDSFSGGGGHSSSGSGGGGGGGIGFIFELIYWLIRLILFYPQIGLPVLALVIGGFLYSAYHRNQNRNWDSGPPVELEHATEHAVELTDLQDRDPAFSQIVFEDFAFRLFSTAQRARHSAEALAAVAPYIGEAARGQLAARAPAGEPVLQVVVGALRTYHIEIPARVLGAQARPNRVRIGLEYEANLATAKHTYYTVERWQFARDADVHSKPPGAARTFPCPNCGAPWQATQTGTQVCASCGKAVDNGRFDWIVERAELASSDERPPTLTTEVPERGTELPTYRQPGFDALWAELLRNDPAVTEPALEARLRMIYDQLNIAWSHNDLRPVRGLVSDGLYDYLQYWVDAYRQQGLRNALDGMRITRLELARLTRDRYFDAITIRIWGTGKDYVIREPGGERVRGSKTRDRDYSEYWTLIRTASRKAAPSAAPTCGNCGAPLQITQSGECEHCGAHVTAGEFDWVVSKIEQDDTYRG